jgi:micrococcal nuclease
MARSRVGLAAVAALLAGAVAAGWLLAGAAPADQPGTVVRTVDGDTIVVAFAGGHRESVRILGVDTPETVKPNTPVQCFGPEASHYTHDRLLGRRVSLEFDSETRDLYGRLLAYVYIAGARFDDELLRRGYGRLLVIAPNDLHARAMLDAETEARRARRGLWRAC